MPLVLLVTVLRRGQVPFDWFCFNRIYGYATVIYGLGQTYNGLLSVSYRSITVNSKEHSQVLSQLVSVTGRFAVISCKGIEAYASLLNAKGHHSLKPDSAWRSGSNFEY